MRLLKENTIKILPYLILALILSSNVLADESKDRLACMAGASADIDGDKSYPTNAASIRFILTLSKRKGKIIAINIKHTGALEGMPDTWYQCSVNGAGNIYTCINGAEVVWYYPARKHGVIANLSIVPVMKENRANAAGIYNYSCSGF